MDTNLTLELDNDFNLLLNELSDCEDLNMGGIIEEFSVSDALLDTDMSIDNLVLDDIEELSDIRLPVKDLLNSSAHDITSFNDADVSYMEMELESLPPTTDSIDSTFISKEQYDSLPTPSGKHFVVGSKTVISKKGFFQTESLEDKDKKRFIKNCETLVRRSIEYIAYLAQLKGFLDLTRCSFLHNIDGELASIEMHHYPFSLYDITEAVYTKRKTRNEPITSMLIADEVLELHFMNLVGLVPLSITVHQLTHSGRLFINMSQVFGYVSRFTKMYCEYIPEENMQKLLKIIELSQSNASMMDNDELLQLYKPKSTSSDKIPFTSDELKGFASLVLKMD